MIILFKTNVGDKKSAENIIKALIGRFRVSDANFDLEDCDQILRISSGDTPVDPHGIISLVRNYGYSARLL